MKKLKLFLLTLLSVISFNLFSQTQVYTTNTTGPNTCDGTAVLDTTNIDTTTIYWQGMGAIINQGNYIVTNLCPGTYMVTFTTNGTSTTLTFVITEGIIDPCLNFGGFLTTTNATDSTSCDGIATATITNGTAPYTYLWCVGTTIQTQTSNILCPGLACCYVIDANGCSITLTDTIGVQTPNYGDTLVVTNTGMCSDPTSVLSLMVEDCNLNFNLIDSAYITNITTPINSLDSVMVLWTIVDTNGVNVSQYQMYNFIPTTGCYNFQLVIYCYQKSMNYKTIVINENRYVGFSGINELTLNNRELIRVVDMMGRETKITNNQPLIYVYSDGTKEIKCINE